MASPPFNPNENQPADQDQGRTYPLQERTFRDIIESWIQFEHHESGRHTFLVTDTTGRNAVSTWEIGSVMYNTDHLEFQTHTAAGVWKHSGFDAGTFTAFRQTAAPTGWTQRTEAIFSDAAPRLVTSWGTVSGGTIGFSTTMGAMHSITGTVAEHTLALSEMAAHQHTVDINLIDAAGGAFQRAQTGSAITRATDSVGGGGAHTHSWSGTIDLAVKFFDIIISSRNTA